MTSDIVRMTVVLAVTCVVAISLAAEEVPREELGRSVKLMILVDKVMQPEAEWTTEEWMIKETAEAGFNVFSPRAGYDRLDDVRQVTEWCEKYGLYHMPWMRGTLNVPKDAEAQGKRMVWAGGNEQELWSPNSDEFWAWTTEYIVEYAKISAENEHLMGVFLDYENYSPGGSGNCYSLSYDDIIMGKFAEAQGIELPELELAQRKGWLEEQEMHEEFSEFQINHWRERCRTLREAVDEHDPKFQFCIYPAPGTMFMVEACYPEWATEAAPLILADPWTYGRPSKFLPEAEAVEGNRQKLLNGLQVPQETGIPFIYAGGIDPVVRGADPEFCGKNAVMISDVTDGYWIFYEGPKYQEDHPEYFKWFTWANQAIAEGNFEAQHHPRETPEDFGLAVFDTTGERPRLVPPEVTGETVEYPLVKMRGDNLMFIAAKAGQAVEVVLENQPLAHYTSLLVWDLRDSAMEKIEGGRIPNDERGTITFTPETDGLYMLGAGAGSCTYSVISSNAPIGLYAADRLQLIFGAERLYFKVPDGVEEFIITATGSGGETVRVNVYDPEDQETASGQTTLATRKIEIKVPVGDQAGKVWSLSTGRADEGALEDNSIKLDPKLPPMLSFVPEHVFGLGPAE